MRTYYHFRFCCNVNCVRNEMKRLAETMGISPIEVNRTEFTVEIPGYQWKFFPSVRDPHRIFGSIVDSWDICNCDARVPIHPGVREYLSTHVGREKWK